MKSPTPRLAQHKLRVALAFIEDHLAEKITSAALAATVHTSPFHFSRTFKAATGLPPHAFVTMRRMELSKALLAGTELSIIEVALRAGYQTQAHFTGMFHKRVGTTPSAFRRVCKVARSEALSGRFPHSHTNVHHAETFARSERRAESPSAVLSPAAPD
jgi:AraC-like DNA-binding protein